MGWFMTLCGVCSLAFAVWVATTSVVTDIQLGILVTAVVGGLLFVGIGQLFERIDRMKG